MTMLAQLNYLYKQKVITDNIHYDYTTHDVSKNLSKIIVEIDSYHNVYV